jgi:hypothetical protein
MFLLNVDALTVPAAAEAVVELRGVRDRELRTAESTCE